SLLPGATYVLLAQGLGRGTTDLKKEFKVEPGQVLDLGKVLADQPLRCVMANSQQPWAPFAPSATEPWDLKKVAHLHRRAGFGATWAELQRDLKDGSASAVDRLLKPRPHTPEERQVLDGLRQGV